MTCQGISLGLVSIGCCFFLSVTRRGVFYLFFTRSVSEVTGFLCPEFANYRIVSFTRRIAEITDFLVPIFFFVPNFRIFEFFLHTECRGVSRIFFVPRLVLGSTDRREVIRDFFSSHGLSRNNLFYHELSNYRISFTRNVAEVTDFLLSRDLSLDPLTAGR